MNCLIYCDVSVGCLTDFPKSDEALALVCVTANFSSFFSPCQAAIEKLTWKDRLPGYFINVSSILFMVSTSSNNTYISSVYMK